MGLKYSFGDVIGVNNVGFARLERDTVRTEMAPARSPTRLRMVPSRIVHALLREWLVDADHVQAVVPLPNACLRPTRSTNYCTPLLVVPPEMRISRYAVCLRNDTWCNICVLGPYTCWYSNARGVLLLVALAFVQATKCHNISVEEEPVRVR